MMYDAGKVSSYEDYLQGVKDRELVIYEILEQNFTNKCIPFMMEKERWTIP